MHFQGSERFPAGVEGQLADAGFLATCVPDATVTLGEPDRAAWSLRPKLAFISGQLETHLTVIERVANQSVTFEAVGKGVGASSTVRSQLMFHPDADGLRVDWKADVVALTGLLKMVPKGLIQGAAEKVIAEVWGGVHARLGDALVS
jgi:uncharacterized protein